MSEMDSTQLEKELTEALAATDPLAALDELGARRAGDARAVQRIREVRATVVALQALGTELEQPAAGATVRLPPPRRPRVIPWIAVAASAAAAILTAVLVLRLHQPGPSPSGPEALASTGPAEPPFSAAMSLLGRFEITLPPAPAWPNAEIPVTTMPAWSGWPEQTFSVPQFTWPKLTGRSDNDDT